MGLFGKKQTPIDVQEPAVEALLCQFRDWGDEGDFEAILEYLPKMETPEQHYLAVLALAHAYNNSEKYAEAEACLRQVADRGREGALWHYRLADALLFQDKTESALKHALLAREKDPQFPWSYLLLSKLFYFNGNKSAAREYANTGTALAREAGNDDREFSLLLREMANGADPAVLLKA